MSGTEVRTEKKKSSAVGDFFARLGVLGELMGFLWRRKLYWMIPLVAFLIVFAVIIILGSAGPAGGFIYTLF